MTSPLPPDDANAVPPSGWRRHYLLCVMLGIYTVNYIDRSIISVLAQPIKVDLALSDAGIGLVTGAAFGLLYATMGLPFAWLAERTSRVRLISWALLVWSVMTAVCGLATGFWQLFLARLGVGVGEAACNPTAQSMIADVYPPERRATVLSIYSLGIPLGTLLGAFLAGWIAQSLGWRFAFILIGTPGVLIALLVRRTLREPVRGGSDVHHREDERAPKIGTAMRTIWASRAIRQLVFAFTVAGTAFYALNAFIVAYVLRQFDLPLLQVSVVFGLVFGVSNFAGLMLGGLSSDWLGKRDKRFYGWVPAVAHLITAPLLVTALLQRDALAMTAYFIVPATLCLAYAGPGYAMVHNLVPPRIRATAVAFVLLVSTLVGTTVGPALTGFISDMVAQQAAGLGPEWECKVAELVSLECRPSAASGLRVALICASMLYIWSAVHFFLAGRNYRAELAR